MTTAPERTARRHVVHRLRVSDVEPLTDDAAAVTFDVPPELADEYQFAPGQHVNVELPGGDGQRRSYSICSPAGSGPLRIAVKRIPGGRFSAHVLTALATGDELDVMTPSGTFTPDLDATRARHYALVAAGSGITPIMSIVATVLEVEPLSRVTVLYGNRSTSTVMFVDELGDLKDRYPDRLHLVHVLSREPGSTDLLSGRLDSDRLGRILNTVVDADTVDEWFLCGPYGMIEAARGVLTARGARPEDVHSELYHAGDVPERASPARDHDVVPICRIEAVLDGRQSEAVLDDPDVPVLEAVLGVRNDAPFACKGGVCGTCRAKVLEGEVTMARDYALEADEIAAGYILTCQSQPTTPTLRIDYDR